MDPLDAELAALPPSQRREMQALLALRESARRLAAELGADEGDVFHVLQNLALTPTERLRRGLTHGRRRPRISE